MPTYEYECRSCEHRFELYQPITARPVRKCPACGSSSARRLISTGGGIIFRGSGFYLTDYRSESYRQAAKAEKEAVSGGTGTKESSSTGGNGKAAGSGGRKAKAPATTAAD